MAWNSDGERPRLCRGGRQRPGYDLPRAEGGLLQSSQWNLRKHHGASRGRAERKSLRTRHGARRPVQQWTEEAVVNNLNEPPSLYYNTAPTGNFISLRLIGVKSNRAALGAVLALEQGGDKRVKEVRSGDGYISQSDLRVHFGLGKATKAERMVIRWPSGLVETLKDLAANQYYVVREGGGVDSTKTHGVSGVAIKGAENTTK